MSGTPAFAADPDFADKSIELAEGSDENAGSYTVSVSDLGDAGFVLVRVHDTDQSNKVVWADEGFLSGGEDVDPPAVRNAIADSTLGRSTEFVDGSAARRSLYTAIHLMTASQQENDGELQVYQTDGTTVHATFVVDTATETEGIIAIGDPE